MKVLVALGLSAINNSGMVIFARHLAACITGQTIFDLPEITAQVALMLADTTTLETCLTAPQSETKTGDSKAARERLERSVTGLARLIETLANSATVTEDQRVNVINLAGMEVKSQGTGKKKRIFSVSHGAMDGSVVLTAPSGAVSHEWQYSTDIITFSNKVSLTTTSVGIFEIAGLESGKTFAFFHRSVIPGEVTLWEGPLIIKVR